MPSSYTYKPFPFFLITFLITWGSGFTGAYLSHQNGTEFFQLGLILLGMIGPFISAIVMIYGSKNSELVRDFWDRLSVFKVQPKLLLFILLVMPCVLFLATSVSLLFGQPLDQFQLANQFMILQGQNMLSLGIMVLAPLMEELGWRGYGVDSLRSRFNLFKTSLFFGVLWALWHIPLFFIQGYYQNVLWNTSLIYVANFFISIFPAALLINWIYYRNNRSIIAAFLMHLMFNIFSVLFQTEQFTKCIVTILLLVVSVAIIAIDKKHFFKESF
jgi:membrane protease YdiL (CAAX protease family)